MSGLEETALNTPLKKRFKIFPEDVCIICNAQECDLKNLIANNLQNEKYGNYDDILFHLFNIRILNQEYDIRNTKVCRTCIHRMREALSFRKVVRGAQLRLQDKINLLLDKCSYGVKNEVSVKVKQESKLNRTSQLPANVTQTSKYLNPSKIDNEILDNDYTEDMINDSSDGESSTTSEQMRIATGFRNYDDTPRYIKREKPFERSCRTCPICNQTFEKFRELELHHETHFIKCVCYICGMSFARERLLKFHMTKHTGNTFSCTRCDKKYPSNFVLSVHVKTFHEKEKLFTCYKCKEKFPNRYSKIKHVFHNHPEIKVKTHPCPVCGKVFFGSCQMKLHKETNHDNLQYNCTECDHTTTTKKNLNSHMIVHTGIKKHVCNVCGNAYARRGTLREHLKIHNNIRNYKCDICEKTFVQKCSLKGHMNTHYKNQTWT